MKEVLELIEKKNKEFAQIDFFEFIRNRDLDTQTKLSFAPILAPLALGFGELCRDVFKKEPTNDKIQLLINKHTQEEHFHWVWLLEDMKKLGLDNSMLLSDSLKFVWSENTKKSRFVCTQMERYSFKAEPILKLVVILVAEVTGNVFFAETDKLVKELEKETNEEYRYFGACHMDQELNHNLNKSEVVQFMEGIELTKEEKEKAFEIVEELFAAFTEAVNDFMRYVQANSSERKQLVTA